MIYKKEKLLQQSKLSDEEIIENWKDAADPKYYYYIADMYTSPAWLWFRELAHERGLDNHPEVVKTDVEVLKLVLKEGGAQHPSIPDPPLEFWWYHLAEIEKGTYPLDLLPHHLKDIYQEHLIKLGKL